MTRDCLAIVLAAGVGSRMKSREPKVLHEIGCVPLIYHVLQAMEQGGANQLAVVVSGDDKGDHGGDKVAHYVRTINPKIEICRQMKPLGTAHAALAARLLLERALDSDILIAFGDAPLLEASSFCQAREILRQGADLVVTGFVPPDPSGYGRLVEEKGRLVGIVEERDASSAQKQIALCNGGVMAIKGCYALDLLLAVGNDNAAGEFYLPDIVAIAAERGLDVRAIHVDGDQVCGVNNRVELARVEAIWQQRKRLQMMASGVTLIAPETVTFAYDTEIGEDVTIEPHVFFGAGVRIARQARIRAFSHIEGVVIGEGAQIGPFARLRPGTKLGKQVKIGNFCEVKQAVIDEGAKVNHLSYIGDAHIGADANIGAGTITCNYDGYNKWRTTIGAGAFIGSNSALVAPLTIGQGAYIASGSVITQDVAPQALAFGRARQQVKLERATALRHHFSALRSESKKEKP